MSAKPAVSLCTDDFVAPDVHVAPGLLEKVAYLVLDGYTATSHGGLEVGGVLFGRREGAQVTVESFRPLPCDHSLGPRFILSESDEQELRDLLASPAIDPSLEGLEAVGWYCSHTRSELMLLDREVHLHDKYFVGQHEFVIVFKPRDLRSVTAGIFSPRPDNTIDPDCPSNILELTQLRTLRNGNRGLVDGRFDLPALSSRTPPEGANSHAPNSLSLLNAIGLGKPDKFPRKSRAFVHVRSRLSHKARRYFASKIALTAALIALTSLLGLWRYLQPASAHPANLLLTLRPYAGKFLLSWKSNLAKPKRARVEIFDGDSSEQLNITDIFQPSGVLLFAGNTGHVRAVLTIDTANGAIVRRAAFSDPFAVAEPSPIVDKNSRSEASSSSLRTPDQQLASSGLAPKRVQPRHSQNRHRPRRKRL